MDPTGTIVVENPADGVVCITLNRPQALNALNVDLLSSLVTALRNNGESRIIIIQGAGDRSFCAGEDLKQTLAPKTGTAEELRQAFLKLQDITRLTSSSRAIVISAVQGFAIGGGAEIALAADFVIGGPGARFRFPEVPIGHAATGGITLRLTYLVGLLKAKDLLLTGRWVGAEEALRLGMLSEIHHDPKLRALELALQLAQNPAISLSSSKTSLERSVFGNMEQALDDEVNVANYCFAQSDAAKAFSDFAARKAPAPKTNGLNSNDTNNGVSHRNSQDEVRDINFAFSRAVERFPARTMLRFGGRDFTFQEMDTMISTLSGGLRDAGVAEGNRVLVMMRNSVEMVCSWLAVNRLGAVWVPVNTELRSITLKHVVEAASPKLAVVDSALWPELKSLDILETASIYVNGATDEVQGTNSFASLFDSATHVSSAEGVKAKPATVSAFLYTSGTTGKSKPCVLSHEYFVLQAKALIEGCDLREDDVLYCPFPLFHADATALTMIPAILLGAVAALSIRFSVSGFWDEIRATKATVYDFMGATLALTYKQPPSERDRDHNVRLAWGVPIPYFGEEYERRFGHRLVTLYGSVEASLPIFQESGKPLPKNSCGRPRAGHEIRIVDEDDEEVPVGSPGQLLLRSNLPNAFFQGYFNDAANTAAAFRGTWLHTGDIAKVDAEGNVYFIGRSKEVVRRRGENINTAEVEAEFLQHPEIIVAAVYAVPSELGSGAEEDVKVAVQLRPGSTEDERSIWDWAVNKMARFQVPSVVELVDEIHKTPTGKIEMAKLKKGGGKRFDIREKKKDSVA